MELEEGQFGLGSLLSSCRHLKVFMLFYTINSKQEQNKDTPTIHSYYSQRRMFCYVKMLKLTNLKFCIFYRLETLLRLVLERIECSPPCQTNCNNKVYRSDG